MKKIYFIVFLISFYFRSIAQVQYPAELVIENITFNNVNSAYYYPTNIISPSSSSAPVLVTGTSQVDYVGGNEVVLKEEFTASGISNNGYFIAKTDTMKMVLIDPPVVSPD